MQTLFLPCLRAAAGSLLLILLAAGMAGPARNAGVWLRDFPPPSPFPVRVVEEGDPLRFRVESDAFGVLREAVFPLHEGGGCTVLAARTDRVNGFDLLYQVSNDTDAPQPLPSLKLAGHRLADRIDFLAQATGVHFTPMSCSDGAGAFSPKLAYPAALFSPVIVVRDDRAALGLALVYDVLTARHPVRTSFYRGAGNASWTAVFHLDGALAPGESRLYALTARYTSPADWIHSLAPYRRFLTRRHGAPRYPQDMRPVWGRQMGDTGWLSEENPRGFRRQTRPDLNGWRDEVDAVLAHAQAKGFDRVMVWTPSGSYLTNRDNNFPPQIMSEWPLPMEETADEWRRIPASGIDLLFWWGRSAQFADRWDDDVLDPFDPENPDQKARMLREWQLAIERGASGLGLDAFTAMDVWKAIPWVDVLREARPGSTFVTESVTCDIQSLHTPTYLTSANLYADGESRQDGPHPHLLADYLAPGREIWVQLTGPDDNLVTALQLIGWGMTVVTKGTSLAASDLEEAVRNAQKRR